jgi:hypothetical protein
MVTVLISFGGSVVAGIISSLLTIYLAPRARHEFWSRERITELRLATYDKVNGITAAIYLYEPEYELMPMFRKQINLSAMRELHASLMAARDEVKNRFSDTTLQAYKNFDVLVEASGLPQNKRAAYLEARDSLLQQLHTESLAADLFRL